MPVLSNSKGMEIPTARLFGTRQFQISLFELDGDVLGLNIVHQCLTAFFAAIA